MCGRYTLTKEERKLQKRFGIIDRGDREPFLPRFNISPTQEAPVAVLSESGVEVKNFKWGLIPSWAKEMKIGNSLINARCETVAEKPAFRSAFKRRRCLVLTDGFFEWMPIGKGLKQPVWITQRDKDHFCFAGLWEYWKNPEDGTEVRSFTIVTTTPNDLLSQVHDRMPVILKEESYDCWLDPKVQDKDALLPLLQPYPAEAMEYFPVSTVVNSPRNNVPQCIERLPNS